MEPIIEQLDLPEGYGRPRRTLAWATVRAELERAPHYWVATTRPDGRPHLVPVDGIWLDDVLYYGGSDRAVHYRAALANPEVVVHLPDPIKAVIVEGRARLAKPSPELARRLADATRAKYAGYGYAPEPSAFDAALDVVPRRVIAWTSVAEDPTRFRFA